MKVLHICSALEFAAGGVAKVIDELTEHLFKKGVAGSIFVTTRRDGREGSFKPEGVEVTAFQQSCVAKLYSGHTWRLRDVLQKTIANFDIVHIHGAWHYPQYAAYRAAKKSGIPYIVTTHGAYNPWALNFKKLRKMIYKVLVQKRILQEAAAIHAITNEEVKHIRALGVDTPVFMIPNGIDLEDFRSLPQRVELERLYPDLCRKKIMLFLGRIHPIKGLDLLCRAFAEVARVREDIRLLIVGPDNDGYGIQLKKMLEDEGVLDKVVFTGMLIGREKMAALNSADFCAIPSYSEGHSIVTLEAMACGLPVIITHGCNFPEVADFESGIIIEPDVDQLTEAMARLLDNPELRKEMGENGRRLVADKFIWDKAADDMIELYKSVL